MKVQEDSTIKKMISSTWRAQFCFEKAHFNDEKFEVLIMRRSNFSFFFFCWFHFCTLFTFFRNFFGVHELFLEYSDVKATTKRHLESCRKKLFAATQQRQNYVHLTSCAPKETSWYYYHCTKRFFLVFLILYKYFQNPSKKQQAESNIFTCFKKEKPFTKRIESECRLWRH